MPTEIITVDQHRFGSKRTVVLQMEGAEELARLKREEAALKRKQKTAKQKLRRQTRRSLPLPGPFCRGVSSLLVELGHPSAAAFYDGASDKAC